MVTEHDRASGRPRADRAGLYRGDEDNALPVTWRDELVWWDKPVPLSSLPDALPHYCEQHGAVSSAVACFLGYVERPDPKASRRRAGNPRRLRRVLVYKLMVQRCADCGHDLGYDVETHELWDLFVERQPDQPGDQQPRQD